MKQQKSEDSGVKFFFRENNKIKYHTKLSYKNEGITMSFFKI